MVRIWITQRFMTPHIRPDSRVLMIGWDAADGKVALPLMERGEMPNLARLVQRGMMGDLARLRPVLSPMLWNTIATGHRPDRHGILGFAEVDEALNEVRAVSSLSRRCKALWNIVTQAGGRAHVLNWYAGHPAEPIHGIAVSNFYPLEVDRPGELLPLKNGTVHPAALSPGFAELRMGIEEVTPDILALFVPRMDEVDQEKDTKLADIAKLVAETLTIHAAAIRQLQDDPWNLASLYYPAIDHFSHGFMDFHPPRMEMVSERDFALYSDVVNGAYRLHDLLLGPLLELAGPDAHVVLLSDHGFHSDHLRPVRIPDDPVGPAVQHRDYGILVLAGPGIGQDERIYGALLLDITPTVLTLLGLPVGRDMPGRVLSEAFAQRPELSAIPSWEDLPEPDGRHGPDVVLSAAETDAMMEQFVALGYLQADQVRGEKAVAFTRRENQWALAVSRLDAGRPDLAIPLLGPLCTSWPARGDFGLALADSLRRVGLMDPAMKLIEMIFSARPNAPSARYLLGVPALESGRSQEAVQHFHAAMQLYPDRPDLHARVANAMSRMGRYDEAENAYLRALELDPLHARAWMGRAWTAIRQSRWAEAEQSALQAVTLEFSAPLPHVLLGWSRMAQDKRHEAVTALQMAIRQAPNWPFPQRLLARAMMEKDGPDLVAALDTIKNTKAAQKAAAARRETILESLREIDYESILEGYRKHAAGMFLEVPAAVPFETIIVSGLPRSGTSLVMHMLQSAGVPILTDHQRAPDPDNPEGYLEWEAIKSLPDQPDIIRQADQMAVKVVSPLLRYLPPGNHIRILFLDRPIDEILASQNRMLERQGKPTTADPAPLRRTMLEHQQSVIAGLRQTPNAETLFIPYADLVSRPSHWAGEIAAFLAPMRVLDPALLTLPVRPDLHRNKS